jgi:nitrate/nitrite-specific signal transduction histidine kinase
VLTAVYRTFAALQERHLGLVRLYEFSQALNAAPTAESALRSVLGQVVDVARADAAQIVLSGRGR